MATSTNFKVFSLGKVAEIDTVEGNSASENASILNNTTFGGFGDPLLNRVQNFTAAGNGFNGGVSNAYDTNNNATFDQFSINGGPPQTMDGVAVFDATLFYVDGSSQNISAVIFQDTAGNLYLAPEMSRNADQFALEAKPIRALKLNSMLENNGVLAATRANGTYAVCFTQGTAIQTPRGARLIEDLRPGDHVCTMDNGPQAVRWIGRKYLGPRNLLDQPALRPVLIRKQIIGAQRDLLVSPQHGVLLGRDHLVRAKHLASAPHSHVRIAQGKKSVTYIHLMFDAHQVIWAEGVACESFFPGPAAQAMVDCAAKHELRILFPHVFVPKPAMAGVVRSYGATARAFLPRKHVATQVARHAAIA